MKAKRLPTLTKKLFETTLWKLNDEVVMGHRVHNEFDYETNKVTKLHLYYNDNGHIGTWQKGHNVIFEDNLPMTNKKAVQNQ